MDVSVIIVNYNVKDLLDNCISSIYKSNISNYEIEIYLVDNNSIDGSVNHIRNKYPGVKIIANPSNLGFSKANNQALKLAIGKYILILNPDTYLEEGTFEKLIKFCENNEKIGAVTSKLILENGKLDSACKRSFPTPLVAIPRILGLSKLFPRSRFFAKYNLGYINENQIAEIDSVCGAFMFIPRKVIEDTGYFDEDYFMYGEDIDLCYRIKKNGYKIYYYPEVTTIHLKGSSTRKTNLSYVNNFYGAMSIFIKKNFRGINRILSPVLRFGIFYRSMLSYIKRILIFLIFPIIDIVLIYFSLIYSVYLRFNILPNEKYLFIITIYVLVWIFLQVIFGAYIAKSRLNYSKTFNAIFFGFFVNSSITYFFKDYAFSREVVLTSTVISLFLLLFWRGVFRLYKFFVLKNILLKKINLLIVGKRHLNQDIEDKLVSKYNILFFNQISENKTLSDLEEIIQINKVHQVIFTDDLFSNQDILKTMWSFKNRNIVFKIAPSGKELILSKLHSSIDELSLVEIEYNINNKLNIFLKRTFDIVLSIILLIFVYPFVVIKKEIFKKEYTKVETKLILLPDVLTGKYSFVGIPDWYESNNKEYLGKKGLTGLIQLHSYENLSAEDMDSYNIFYAKNQSLIFDIEILLKTIFLIFKK